MNIILNPQSGSLRDVMAATLRNMREAPYSPPDSFHRRLRTQKLNYIRFSKRFYTYPRQNKRGFFVIFEVQK